MAPKISFDPYEVLGIKKGCTEKEIQQAYKKQCLKWHPDKNRGNEKEAEKRFIQAKEAFEFLYVSEQREEYDKETEKAAARDAMFRERMEKADASRKKFIDELNEREKRAAEQEKTGKRVMTEAEEIAKKRQQAKRVKHDFDELRRQLEKEAEAEMRAREEKIRRALHESTSDATIIDEDDHEDCPKLRLKWSPNENCDYDEAKLRQLFSQYGEISEISSIVPLKKGKSKMCVIEFSKSTNAWGAELENGDTVEIKANWLVEPKKVCSTSTESKTTEEKGPSTDFSAMSFEELQAKLFGDMSSTSEPPTKKWFQEES